MTEREQIIPDEDVVTEAQAAGAASSDTGADSMNAPMAVSDTDAATESASELVEEPTAELVVELVAEQPLPEEASTESAARFEEAESTEMADSIEEPASTEVPAPAHAEALVAESASESASESSADVTEPTQAAEATAAQLHEATAAVAAASAETLERARSAAQEPKESGAIASKPESKPVARQRVSSSVSDAESIDAVESGEPIEKKRRIVRWGSMKYTTRLVLTFAFVAAMTALVTLLVLSFVWGQYFRDYTRDNMQTISETTAERIAEKYEKSGGWTQDVISTAMLVGTTYSGVGIMVENSENVVFYDSSRARNDALAEVSPSLAPSSDQQVASSPIMVRGRCIGYVRVWVYGSDTLLRQTDQQFRDSSYQAMVLAGLFAIALATIVGFLFARSLVHPISRMTKTVKAIKEGNLSARTNLRGEDEIASLGEMFDAMADSVEKDRELERRLTTDVAHELRTPLMAIQATVEAMIDGVFEPDQERLETVNSEVQRLSRLVGALLKLSRLESRSTPFKKEVIDVSELVSGILVTHEAFVNEAGLSLESRIQSDVFVCGDADMIRQATANLISNAVRYTPEGGKILVSVKRGELMAGIAVQDTGIGLTPEEAKMVFSRFWRADAGRTRASGGLGIGLSVVKEIVDRHGGWVKVEGKPGKGARFTILIPLYDKNRQKSAEREVQKQQRIVQRQMQRESKGRFR